MDKLSKNYLDTDREPGQCSIAGHNHQPGETAMRRAFTLIEMLVVLVIVATIMAMAVGAMHQSDTDRIDTAATLVQQRVLLAKSSAATDRRVRGVRFNRSATDPHVVTSLTAIGSSGYSPETLSNIRSVSGDPGTSADDYWEISGQFDRLWQRRMISVGGHVEIPEGSGHWYVISDKHFDPAGGTIALSGHYAMSHWGDDPTQPQPGEYIVNHQWNNDPTKGPVGLREVLRARFELGMSLMDSDPLALPPGTCIDLDASLVPDAWRAPGADLDLMFKVTGGTDSGLINLYVTTLADVEMTRGMFFDHPANGGTRPRPIVPGNAPHVPATEPYLITVLPGTGYCYTCRADLTDANADLQADDPYVVARRGGH